MLGSILLSFVKRIKYTLYSESDHTYRVMIVFPVPAFLCKWAATTDWTGGSVI